MLLALVVVAVVLLALTGLLVTAWWIARSDKTGSLVESLQEAPEAPPEEDVGPLSLVPDGQGGYLSWNDNTFQALKALYPTLDGNLNDYLYRYQQDNP